MVCCKRKGGKVRFSESSNNVAMMSARLGSPTNTTLLATAGGQGEERWGEGRGQGERGEENKGGGIMGEGEEIKGQENMEK